MGRDNLILAADFNGVIHDHQGKAGFCEAGSPEIPGAITWLKEISETYDVFLVSASFSKAPFVVAARAWLEAKGVPRPWLTPVPVGRSRITLTPFKPACVMFIDDRGFQFVGTFPTLEAIQAFKPWNR